jgi:ribosomal protein S18 acetylase RimI-like enzyme
LRIENDHALNVGSSVSEEQPERDGEVDILGIRRAFRGQGIGQALLLDGLHRLCADGNALAMLVVDAENLTGATRLYTAVGFATTRTWVRHGKSLT